MWITFIVMQTIPAFVFSFVLTRPCWNITICINPCTLCSNDVSLDQPLRRLIIDSTSDFSFSSPKFENWKLTRFSIFNFQFPISASLLPNLTMKKWLDFQFSIFNFRFPSNEIGSAKNDIIWFSIFVLCLLFVKTEAVVLSEVTS